MTNSNLKLKKKLLNELSYKLTETIPLNVPSLPQLIKFMRLQRHLTQKELGLLINVKRQHIQKWEYGICRPKPKTLQYILDTLKFKEINFIIQKFYI